MTILSTLCIYRKTRAKHNNETLKCKLTVDSKIKVKRDISGNDHLFSSFQFDKVVFLIDLHNCIYISIDVK